MDKTIKTKTKQNDLIQNQLQKMLKQAYSPYSKVKVACLLQLNNGNTFCGCNIENASYSCTICAERCAIFNAVSSGADLKQVENVYIMCDQSKPFSPCGACRQVMSEFLMPDVNVMMLTSKNKNLVEQQTLKSLLPLGFKL